MLGYIYRLICVDEKITDFYIGSSFNCANRYKSHKKPCNNVNNKGYNSKLYIFIRNNGGFDNWVIDNIAEIQVENKRELEMVEQQFIELLNPSLNMRVAFLDPNVKKKYMEEFRKSKVVCSCGFESTKNNIARHMKTDTHFNNIILSL
jgi:hypothetical protein